MPRHYLTFIDGIVLTESERRSQNINKLVQLGIEPRKIILWNNQGVIEFFQATDAEGKPVVFMEGLQFHIRNKDDEKFLREIHGSLQRQRQFYSINPEYYPQFVAQQYRQSMSKPLDRNNLRTWTEKMQWIKLFDSTPLKTRLADKYLVRQWVAEKIGAEYLIPLYGVWDKFDDIDFDILPDQFVLKCNHGSGMNIICRDKNNFDKEGAKQKLTAWLQIDFGAQYFEPQYCNIKRKIIAEKFIKDMDGGLNDYKVHCYHGKAKFIQTIGNRDLIARTGNQNFYDFSWQDLGWTFEDYPNFPKPVLKPICLEEFKQCAEKLSEDFHYVRVDFYEIGGKVYFGEMTFTPAVCFYPYKKTWTEKLDAELGNMLTLPPAPSALPIRAEDFNLKYSVRQKINLTKNILPRKNLPFGQRVIASLTSWRKRISTVHLAIQTILAQTRQPDLTVLYLADSEFPNREKDLPRELTALLSDRFQIRWTKDIKSYKKLIPALKDFPDDVIITFDDDIFYDRRLVEISLDAYLKNPQYIHCHRVTAISFDEQGEIKTSHIPYDNPTYLNKLSGGLACLYPPHSLHEEVLREEKFMTLAPTSDDIWFWLMGVLNGCKVSVVNNNLDALNYIPNTQDTGLNLINDHGEKLFFVQLKNILNTYPVLKDILESEYRRVIPQKIIDVAPPEKNAPTKIAVWGYRDIEKNFAAVFKARIRDAEFVCFVDNVNSAVKDSDGNLIISPFELKILLDSKKVDKVIVLADTHGPGELREVMKKCFQQEIDFRKILFYIEIHWFMERLNGRNVTSFKNLLADAKRKLPVISGLEYEMVEKCNLNCKRCNHYSNIFTEGKLIDFETFCADMELLSKLTCNIKRFKLLGGEPLLHPELYRFVEFSRKIFPRAPLSIVTNGFLIPKMNDAAIKAIKDTGTVVEISIYPPMKKHFGEVEKFLQAHGIKYKIFRDGDQFGAYLNTKGDSNKMWAMMQCYAQVCHAIKNGYLYKCTASMNISLLNKKFGTNFPAESLKLSEIPKDSAGEVLTKYLLGTLEMCRFCTSFKYYDWEATRNDAKLDDWIVT